MAFRLFAKFASALTIVSAEAAFASQINLDFDRGETNAAFEWQGLEFEQQSQPGSRVSAAGRVEGDSDGELTMILEEGQSSAVGSSAKITFGAELPESERFELGFKQPNEETSAFSNQQGFFRRFSGGPQNTVVQLLPGVDENNPGSPFAGLNTRADSETGFQVSDFVDNVGLGSEGLFQLTTASDGFTSGEVRIDGRSARVARDLGDFSDFRFDELLLQVETFQPDAQFQNQFGADGQRFTFTSFQAEVPLPPTVWLMGLGILAIGSFRPKVAAAARPLLDWRSTG